MLIASAAAPPNHDRRFAVIEANVASGGLCIRSRAIPLPAPAAFALESAATIVNALQRAPADATLDGELAESVATLHDQLAAAADDAQVLDGLHRACLPVSTLCGLDLLV